jgi:hypothetical protein
MPEQMPFAMAAGAFDQASGLRRLFAGVGARVVPLVSSASLGRRPIEMARALAAHGERVLILDHEWTHHGPGADVGRGDLSDLVAGRVSVDEVTCELAPGVRWMPVGKAFSVVNARGGGCDALFARLQALAAPLDVILLASGQPLALSSLLAAGCEFVLFATTDPAGLAGAYQMLKSLAVRGAGVRIVLEGVSVQAAADRTFRRLESTAARFLRMMPERGGSLPAPGDGQAQWRDAATDLRASQWLHLALASRRWQSAVAPIDGIGRPTATTHGAREPGGPVQRTQGATASADAAGPGFSAASIRSF